VFLAKNHHTIQILIFFFFLETKNTLAKISELSSNTLDYARKKIQLIKKCSFGFRKFSKFRLFPKYIFFRNILK